MSKKKLLPTEDQIIDTIMNCVDIRGIDLENYRHAFTDKDSGLITALRDLFSPQQSTQIVEDNVSVFPICEATPIIKEWLKLDDSGRKWRQMDNANVFINNYGESLHVHENCVKYWEDIRVNSHCVKHPIPSSKEELFIIIL